MRDSKIVCVKAAPLLVFFDIRSDDFLDVFVGKKWKTALFSRSNSPSNPTIPRAINRSQATIVFFKVTNSCDEQRHIQTQLFTFVNSA